MPLPGKALFRAFAATLSLGLLTLGCGGGASGPDTPPTPKDILTALRDAPGVQSVQEVTGGPDAAYVTTGVRCFEGTFSQATDHFGSGAGTFAQYFYVVYRSATAPVVLHTTGYGCEGALWEEEPTLLLNANQITVEERFFQSSVPSSHDWTKLDIRQAAADHHAIVQALKPLFSGKWMSTGISKGGMTSVYHRRFYPADVDATLAYVAPNMSGDPDARFVPFVAARGGTATAAALHAWQQAVFDNWDAVKALLVADMASHSRTTALLGADKTLELAVVEVPFTIWQYSDATLAAQVPGPGATPEQLYAFMNQVYHVVGGIYRDWDDSALQYFQAFYYQAGTQLGYPEVDYSFTGIPYPGLDVPSTYPPLGVTETFDASAMADIQAWVGSSAQRMIFLYGENDPFTAAAFQVTDTAAARGNHLYVVPGGNHRSRIADMPNAQQRELLDLLSTWLGVPPITMVAPKTLVKRTLTRVPHMVP